MWKTDIAQFVIENPVDEEELLRAVPDIERLCAETTLSFRNVLAKLSKLVRSGCPLNESIYKLLKLHELHQLRSK
jgi:hypothetical protein